MTQPTIEIEGIDELIKKYDKMPKNINDKMNKTMEASLRALNSKVPGYPPQRENMVRPYKRTGTLGRSIGVGGAKPTVYSITGSGGNIQGRFGTDLSYAKYVIDEKQQAYMHKNWWWTLDFVARRSKDTIVSLWNRVIQALLNKP